MKSFFQLGAAMKVATSLVAAGEELPYMVELSVVPVMKVLTMCGLGYVLAQPKIRIIGPEAAKLLIKLVFALFLPCLIFTELGQSVTLSNMRDWWFIPVNVMLSAIIGCLVGVVVALICRPPPQFFKFTVVMTGIGNTGFLPLGIIGAICHGQSNPFGPKCNSRGVAYVAFSQWVSAIIIYTFVYHMLEPPEEYYEVVVSSAIAVDDPEAASHSMSSKDDDNNIGQVSLMPSVTSVEWPDVNDAQNEESRTPLLARIFRYPSLPSQTIAVNMLEGGGASPRSNGPCIAEPQVLRKMRVVAEKTPIQHMLQPPIIASLLAIVVGSFPNTSSLLFGDDAPLAWITDSLTILGAALIPSVMLGLGSTLSEGPGQHSNLGLRTMVGISFTRLVVLPPLGIGVVHLAAKLGVLPASHDKMYLFVLLLQHSMPTSILAGGMTRLRGFAEHEASALLFWQHVFAVVPIAIYIMLYLQIVSTYI
ncbi:unnamed protein product [Sphagnum troendelagicum]|uniref:PIN-like protein n=1 Tax=Sphagnum troendelagicum TaxID=128251 RepID=A0ABP0U972_9BRYO